MIATRLDDEQRRTVHDRLAETAPEATVEDDERARTLVATVPSFDPPELDATVGVVTGGT
ncbi:hypothetical protein GJ629_13910, partial [Halapricum sp. CBA1109]|nr:hypothetical protein [Halapricum sp. CBA1109]